jgi:hypothetical protein
MNDFAETFDAFTPPPAEAPAPAWALIEIFGHRQHYGEIRDVEIAGVKLLEVRDVDTDKVHMYGASAIFSLTPMTQGEIDAHMADTRRCREEAEKWKREREERAQARLAAPDEGDGIPF